MRPEVESLKNDLALAYILSGVALAFKKFPQCTCLIFCKFNFAPTDFICSKSEKGTHKADRWHEVALQKLRNAACIIHKICYVRTRVKWIKSDYLLNSDSNLVNY